MNRNNESNLRVQLYLTPLENKTCCSRVGLDSRKKYRQQNSISNNNAVDTVDLVHEISLNLQLQFE